MESNDEQTKDVPSESPGGGFPEPPGKDPGDISKDPSPYHSLNNPVGEPDPTEWPDPYEQREDPRDAEGGEHTPTGAQSTSDPHPDQDPMAQAQREKIERDKLDQ